jgi:hypothetical protein
LLDSTIIRVVLVPASMKLMGGINWWMPKWLDWFPQFDPEGGAAEDDRTPIPASSFRPCPTCGVRLPFRARFCGRCGTTLRPMPQPAMATAMAGGPGETLVTSSYARRAEGGAREQGVAAGIPPSTAGLRRIPIMLRIGRVQQRAWLSLRDCQVEKDPTAPSVPIVSVDGLEVMPLPGQDPPEIQVRNARVRL